MSKEQPTPQEIQEIMSKLPRATRRKFQKFKHAVLIDNILKLIRLEKSGRI
jgi:hypothetical protein